MTTSPSLLQEEPPISEFTEDVRRNRAITWYRTPLTAAEIKSLHAKSDLLGACQTLGYLAILCAAGGSALYAAGHGHWWLAAAMIFLEGTVGAFLINGMHELGHNTVFRTKALNELFCGVLSFLGWMNHEMFHTSHTRHHRYTLHPPEDLEVTQPIRLVIGHALKYGIINVTWFRQSVQNIWRIARGRFAGEWELTLFPLSALEKRRKPVRWARLVLAGHAIVLIVSLSMGWWLLPVVVSCIPLSGGWLNFFCNNTQHVGLQDNVADFRLCCRTFTLNPFVRFLYWQMNYHTEHHMYAAVPCYRLAQLHRLIRHDLPPTPHGLVAVWREIASILAKQQKDPAYRHVVPLPPPREIVDVPLPA